MSEYWVSQAKFYCKYCNSWMGDNKPSRDHHNNSLKHKINVDAFNKKKRDEKFHGARSEYDLKKQLADIEKAAQAAIDIDREEHGDLFYRKQKVNAPQPPSVFHTKKKSTEDIESDSLAENKTGLYTIRGQSYLEGQMNESLLKTGITCQIFVEDKDDWFDAVITGGKEISIPHTALTIKTFKVQYLLDDDKDSDDGNTAEHETIIEEEPVKTDVIEEVVEEEEEEEEEDNDMSKLVEEDNVRSERIRLLANEEGIPVHLDGAPILEIDAPMKSAVTEQSYRPMKIDENTGVSAWKTVSVTIIDEEEVAKQRIVDALAAKEEIANRKKQTALKKELERTAMLAAESGDVLSAFDPYGTNVYKGFKINSGYLLNGNQTRVSSDEVVGGGPAVSFKKRRKVGADIDDVKIKSEEGDKDVKVKVEEMEVKVKIEGTANANSIQGSTSSKKRNIRSYRNDN